MSATPGDAADAGDARPLGADDGDATRLDTVVDHDASSTLLCREECACERRGDREFMFCETSVTHDDAAARCGAAGGTLSSVDDAEQNAWLTERMQTLAKDDFWLSGTDAQDEGVWRWQDGRVFYDQTGDAAPPGSFAAWEATQPNDLNGEDCMRSIGGIWRDLDCAEAIAYACQG